jgi:pilus assembly protein TadC
VVVTALLVALASSVAASRPPVRRRLPKAFPDSRVEREDRPLFAAIAGPMCLLAGLATALALRNPVGVCLGALVAFLGPRFLGRLETRERQRPVDDVGLPLALDLLAACLAGGAVPHTAVAAVADATAGATGARLREVAAALALGVPPGEAFTSLGDDGPAGAAARTLRRALEGGTPVADAVARVAEEARHSAAMSAHARAKRVAVTAVAPLITCFLPSFVLIGIVPSLYAAFVDVLGELA